MSSQDQHQANRSKAIRLARLVRIAREVELGDATCQLIREHLLSSLGVYPGAAEVSTAVKSRELASAKPAEAECAKPARPGVSPAKSSSATGQRISQLEMRLRHLTEHEAPWDEIEPLVMELYRLSATPTTAARALELAYLFAPLDPIEALLKRFATEQAAFWRHIHKAVRGNLTLNLWAAKQSDLLLPILYREKDQGYLQGIERFCVFWSLLNVRDGSPALVYFRKFRDAITQAAENQGAKVGISPALFYLAVGRLTAEFGETEEARAALELVPSDAPERDEALRLLLEIAVDRNRAGRSHYMEMIYAAASDQDRVKLLKKFLAATRGMGGFRDRNRPALNEIVLDPLLLVQEDADTWRSLSLTIFEARDLEGLIPNLLAMFRKNAERFYAPLLDAALWQGPLLNQGDAASDLYWRGVALLHHYVNSGVAQQEALWQARDLVTRAKQKSDRPLPLEWRELHKAAFAWIAKNHYLIEPDRERMLRQMRIAVEAAHCAKSDIEDYLKDGEKAPVTVLSALQTLVRDKRDPELEYRLILKRATHTHLTNADLNRLWHLANASKDADLAWRIATILNARLVLLPQVRAAWEISGEKRSQYTMLQPPREYVEILLNGFEPQSKRLAFACLTVGWALPDLLAIMDEGARTQRRPATAPDSVERRVDEALAAISWLGAPRRRYRFSFEASPLGTGVPNFVQVLPSNAWSVLMARLSERLGINAWGWKLSRLHQQIEGLIPRIASRQDLRRHSGKVADWLKMLTPEQRSAWQDMALLSRTIEDDRGVFTIAAFICRFATMIYSNHFMALQSLQTMRAPIEIIWDLEHFILSEAYGKLRQESGLASRVPVPNALQRLTSILTPQT